MKVDVVAVVVVMLGSGILAQSAPPMAPPPQSGMVRAAGMPLQDGALPPGTLTVRIVLGAFDGDQAGITVEVESAGAAARSAVTNAAGRAEFAHLAVGAQVRASALVGGERVQSQMFTMPAESGVRVLLIVGAGSDGAPAADGLHAAAGVTVPPPAPIVQAPATAADNQDADGWMVRFAVVAMTVIVFAFVGVQQWRRRRD